MCFLIVGTPFAVLVFRLLLLPRLRAFYRSLTTKKILVPSLFYGLTNKGGDRLPSGVLLQYKGYLSVVLAFKDFSSRLLVCLIIAIMFLLQLSFWSGQIL